MSTKPRSPSKIVADEILPFSTSMMLEEAAEWGRQQADTEKDRLFGERIRAATNEELRAECERRGLATCGHDVKRMAHFHDAFMEVTEIAGGKHFHDTVQAVRERFAKNEVKITIELPPGGTVKVG